MFAGPRLARARGPASVAAMRLLTRSVDAVQAPRLIDAEAAYIDGCLHHGQMNVVHVCEE
jgi:predicted aconitase